MFEATAQFQRLQLAVDEQPPHSRPQAATKGNTGDIQVGQYELSLPCQFGHEKYEIDRYDGERDRTNNERCLEPTTAKPNSML